jgi:uncharacterized protein (TIGR03435 family)
VKPNKSGDPHGTIVVQPGGRFVAINVPVRQLITYAYGLQASQLGDGPTWSRTDRFDVTAKAGVEIQSPDGTPSASAQLMLQALLAERFKLAIHREPRELPIYVLVLARSDRSLGPGMRASTTDCSSPSTARGRSSGPPTVPVSFTEPVTCGVRMGHGRLTAADATLPQFITSLANTVQRVVQDRTGLVGRYDMVMTWVPDSMPQSAQGPGTAVPTPLDPNGVSIFTALQEQLGLKLESSSGQVEVVVIDSLDRPTPD